MSPILLGLAVMCCKGPAAGELGERAFAQAAQGPLDGVAHTFAHIQFPPAGGLFDKDEDAAVGAFTAGIGQGAGLLMP